MKPGHVAIIAIAVIAAVYLISQTSFYKSYANLPSGNTAAAR